MQAYGGHVPKYKLIEEENHNMSLYCSCGVIQVPGRLGSPNDDANNMFLAKISCVASSPGVRSRSALADMVN